MSATRRTKFLEFFSSSSFSVSCREGICRFWETMCMELWISFLLSLTLKVSFFCIQVFLWDMSQSKRSWIKAFPHFY